ncbi:MAG: hypothetical protein KJZ84_05415 [Bryobacteraceae bacterium]|nr:hypothetical protein [Bryobacteraceae bacterium]
MNDAQIEAIDRARGIYGMAMLRLNPAMDELLVHYDASRLKLPDVENALRRIGLPIRRKEASA